MTATPADPTGMRHAITLVCRCEEVAVAEIEAAIATGATSINDIKRRTRAGMGICQGIYCTVPVADLLRAAGQAEVDLIVPMTARPPVRALPLHELAALADPDDDLR